MSVNVDLLRRTLAHIEQHPEEWDQGTWRCGTAACFAGHAAILAGGRWSTDSLLPYATANVVSPDGSVRFVAEFAEEQLGLTDGQWGQLFHFENTLDDLRRIVGELCDGAA